MAAKIKKLNHGRETSAVYYGNDFVLKRPLPGTSEQGCQAWLEKQHRTQKIINAIRAINNPVYNVPEMRFINDDEKQILEERAPGVPLTRELYRKLSRRQQYEINTSIASFLVDMNELKPVQEQIKHKISDELKISTLNSFIENKMNKFFNNGDVLYMARLRDKITDFEYTTRMAWSHGDLNSGNVFYDAKNSKLSFIDFAEADYNFIYRDIFAPLQVDLEICKPVYEIYIKLHNKKHYSVLSVKNDTLREIMKYRIIVVYLKRFIKAADDIKPNTITVKGAKNNAAKVAFMQGIIRDICKIEQLLKNK